MSERQGGLSTGPIHLPRGLGTLGLVLAMAALVVLSGLAIPRRAWVLPGALLGMAALVVLFTQPLRRLFLLWLVLGPVLARWRGIDLGSGVPNITFDRFMAVVFLLKLVDELFHIHRTQPYRRLAPELVDLCFAVWVMAWLASELLRSPNLTEGLFNALQIAILPVIVFYAARLAIRSEEDIRLLLGAAAFVASYLVAGALVEQVTRSPILPGQVNTGLILAGVFRSGSFLNAPWTLGFVLLLFLPWMFYAEDTSQIKSHRRLYRIVIAAILVGLLVTFIRSVWIAFALESLLIAGLFPRWRGALLAAGTVLGVALFAAWPTLGESKLITDQLGNPTNFIGRVNIAQSQLGRFWSSPWIGLGAGQGRAGLDQTAAHNTWLVMLVELGLVGVVPLLLGIGSVVLQEIRSLGETKPFARWRAVLLVGLVSFAVVSNAVDLTYFAYELSLAFSCLGLLLLSRSKGDDS